jgi:hypothetical protein
LAVGRFGRGEGIPPSVLVGALPCAGPPGARPRDPRFGILVAKPVPPRNAIDS